MKLATFKSQGSHAKIGIVQGDVILDIEAFGFKTNFKFPTTMLELIDSGPEVLQRLIKMVNASAENLRASVSIPIAEVELLAPIPKPRKNIIGIGLNYTEHIAESARTLDTSNELPQQPVIFSKPPTAVTATGKPILLNPKLTQQLDYEVELAVIIGKGGKYIPKESALEHVFGYTVINDVSARDCRRAGQWIVSKGQDTFAPMGPFLVTADEIPDAQNLNLSLKLNGIEMQNSNTQFMLFSIADLIQDLSTVFTLEPGDIIATGTPAGVGAGRNPQQWMWDGDVVEATVERIGTLINTVKEISEL